MRDRTTDPRGNRDDSAVLERKLRHAERRIAALARELALTSEQLALTKRQMGEAQERRIEEERLKVVLQMAGATASELDQPLTELLNVCAALKPESGCPDELCAKISDLKRCAAHVQQIINRVEQAQANLLAPMAVAVPPAPAAGVYRILLLEHEEQFASSLYALLEPWSDMIQLERVSTCGEAAARLDADHFDLILSDCQLPDGASLDLFTLLTTRMVLPPFILISSQGSEDIVAQAVRRGACDYIPKAGLDRDRLIQSILAALERVRLQQELQTVHHYLAEMATHDELTGLFNRRYLIGALETELNRAQRYHQPLTLCLFDLDYFKQLNDRYGHDAGDTVLVSVAETLHQTVRSPDVAGRYGGEEFLILLVNTDLEEAGYFSDRLRQNVSEKRFHFLADGDVRVTCSIGLAAYDEAGTGSAELVHRADMAMYRAKRQGRNRVCALA